MTKRTKPSADAEEAVKRPQAARQAAKSAKAAKGSRARDKGSRRAPAAPGRAKAPGRVVAIGVDVPRLDDLAAEAEARKAVEDEVKREGRGRGGRPTDYRPHFAEIARGMAVLGGTDFEIAEELGIKTATLWRWRSKYPDFCSALIEGKEAFDNRIERSLAQRAAGFSVHSEKVFNYEGTVIRAETVEFYPPDVGAIKLWLGNRRPDKWRDKSEVKMDSSECFLQVWRAISEGRA